MFLYRIARFFSEGFPFIAMGAYILLFGVVLLTVFLMPPVGLVIFFLCLASLPVVWAVGRVFQAVEGTLALRMLGRGVCPRCSERMQSQRDPDRLWRCAFCETRFEVDGLVRSDRMIDDPAHSAADGPGAAASAAA